MMIYYYTGSDKRWSMLNTRMSFYFIAVIAEVDEIAFLNLVDQEKRSPYKRIYAGLKKS